MCVASAEKSGWSTETFRGLFAAIIFFTGGGLLDLDVEAPDVRGLAILDIVETVVVLPDRRCA
jgi:hypothetical protein